MPDPTIRWVGGPDGHVELIDQTLLPLELRYLEIRTKEEMWQAIQRLSVRGAPAIGVAASFGVVLGLQGTTTENLDEFRRAFDETATYLETSRPTAVNLFWAVDRMRDVMDRAAEAEVSDLRIALFERARELLADDVRVCQRLGVEGADLIDDGDRLLTHCNAGALATAGSGTALSVMFEAKQQGRQFEVFVDETRPLLQGARLTSWELMRAEIPSTLICDNTAGHVMRTRGIDKIFVGADRIAANGDAANKIGTYTVAVLARAHDVPFYVVAPASTFDLTLADGDAIPIEERPSDELTESFGKRTAPIGVRTFSPAFDVTPAALITGIVTEHGLITPVSTESIRRTLEP